MVFKHHRPVHFYETDAMGIVHHSNYPRIFEEARVSLLNEYKVLDELPLSQLNYPLLKLEVDYKRPLEFGDIVETEVHCEIQGAKLHFEYRCTTKRFADAAAFGRTIHATMDMRTQKIVRIPETIKKILLVGTVD